MDSQATNPQIFKRLYESGMSIFPLAPLQKRPSQGWEQYQTSFLNPFDVGDLCGPKSVSNVAVVTGEISNLIVLDIDNNDALAWLRANREIPDTCTVRTPRGYHFYFTHPGFNVRNVAGLHRRDGDLPEGLDVRGDGGFIVGPGSYYVPTPEEAAKGKLEGSYRFEDGHDLSMIVPAPEWLLSLLVEKPYVAPEGADMAVPHDKYVAATLEGALEDIATAPRGTRNEQLFKSSARLGSFVAAGLLDKSDVTVALENAGRMVGQGETETRETVSSGLKAGMRSPVNYVPRAVETETKLAATLTVPLAKPNAKPFGFDAFRASDVRLIDAPEQEWVIEDFIPMGHVTSLFGDGGGGKTLISQIIASHISSGEPFANRDVKKMRVAAIYCEDDAGELNRRQRRINDRLFDDGQVQDFTIVSRIGEDNVLGFIDKGGWTPSELYHEIETWVEAQGIEVLIIDNIMQVFGGDANDNQSVTWFVNSLTRLARKMGGAIILLGHIAKSENSKFSGAMAWNNAVRSRLFLARSETNCPHSGRVLTVEKSNYGKTGVAIELVLHDGVMVEPGTISEEERTENNDRMMRAQNAIRQLLERDGPLSRSGNSPDSYILSPDRQRFFTQNRVAERDVKAALQVMLSNGVLKLERRIWTEGAKRARERVVIAPSAEQREAKAKAEEAKRLDNTLKRLGDRS